MAYIREYVHYIGGLDPLFYARRSGQILQNRPEGLGPNNTVPTRVESKAKYQNKIDLIIPN